MVTAEDVGHPVRVINRTDEWNGRTGVLLDTGERAGERGRWPVRLDDGGMWTTPLPRHGRCWFMPDELERVPAEATSEDPKR